MDVLKLESDTWESQTAEHQPNVKVEHEFSETVGLRIENHIVKVERNTFGTEDTTDFLQGLKVEPDNEKAKDSTSRLLQDVKVEPDDEELLDSICGGSVEVKKSFRMTFRQGCIPREVLQLPAQKEPLHFDDNEHKCNNRSSPFHDRSALETLNVEYRPQMQKAFSHLNDFAKNTRLQTKRTPQKCTICNKSFCQSSYLKRHMRVHTGEKPYECTTCGKACSQFGNLVKHLKIHTGEKPYKCTICGKAFSTSGSMRSHVVPGWSRQNQILCSTDEGQLSHNIGYMPVINEAPGDLSTVYTALTNASNVVDLLDYQATKTEHETHI
uniref:zinc finger protein 880-like n=1 Tax=Myxine glutinosa TaxID=7769 RepID=UPI00358ED3AD